MISIDVPSPKSPDVSLVDFFSWGNVKDNIYQNHLTIVEELKMETENIVQTINENLPYKKMKSV